MNDEIEKLLIESLTEKLKITANKGRSEIVKLAGDASTRKYYRILKGGRSYVCCLDNPTNGEQSDFEKVTNFLTVNSINVPQIHSSFPEKGFLLQEDLGDDMLVNFLSKDYHEKDVVSWYKKAIDIIGKMQSIDSSSIPEFVKNRKFDKNKYTYELGISTEYFLEKYLNYKMSDKEKDAYSKETNWLFDVFKKEDSTLIHRDFHSRNLMVKENNLVVIDYQDIMIGTKLYDLVSLLEDSYFPLKYETKIKLYDYFRDQVLPGLSDELFIRLYNLNSVQRIYKALGSFTYIYSTRGDDRYLKYVGVGFSRLKDILQKCPELTSFHEIIMRAYHES